MIGQPKHLKHFSKIQKKCSVYAQSKQNRLFLNAANCKEHTPSIRDAVGCREIIRPLQRIFNDITIDTSLILHKTPLEVQGAHQDDKAEAARLASASIEELLRRPIQDMHFVAFGALAAGQNIRVAMDGDPTNLTPYELRPGSLTFMLTNTWHEGDEHFSEQPALKLFIDLEGMPADSDRQRFFDLNNRQTTEAQREEIVRAASTPYIITITL
jgi:hypothetical protein